MDLDLALVSSQFCVFTLRAAAQEPTAEPTPLPTPTPAPTWTPEPTPTNTPDPAATPTADPTANARTVDFRVDDDEITKGDCVMFSWVVRGDIDLVEFDQIGDGKTPLLVSDMDSREECPEEDTEYALKVTWLDSTKTTRSIKIDVKDGGTGDGGGDNGASNGTTTPASTASFVPVTPIPVIGTPASCSAVVTPVGVLGSVQMLPETGYLSSPHDEKIDQSEDDLPNRGSWWAFAGGLAALMAIVVISSALGIRVIRVTRYRDEY
jgi:hypothetical protein